METEQNQEPSDDLVLWARRETVRSAQRKLKCWGISFLCSVALMILISEGMPGHLLWRILRFPFGIACICTFVGTLCNAAILVGEWMDKRKHP